MFQSRSESRNATIAAALSVGGLVGGLAYIGLANNHAAAVPEAVKQLTLPERERFGIPPDLSASGKAAQVGSSSKLQQVGARTPAPKVPSYVSVASFDKEAQTALETVNYVLKEYGRPLIPPDATILADDMKTMIATVKLHEDSVNTANRKILDISNQAYLKQQEAITSALARGETPTAEVLANGLAPKRQFDGECVGSYHPANTTRVYALRYTPEGDGLAALRNLRASKTAMSVAFDTDLRRLFHTTGEKHADR